MASIVKFSTHALLRKPISKFPSKSHFSFPTRLSFVPFAKSQSGFSGNAVKAKKKGGLGSPETNGPDEFGEDFDEGFLEVSDDDDDGFEGEIEMPLMNIKKWLENRPRGFGEGKSYDTSVEDKLMEEIELGKKAQLANVNKLKHSPVGAKKEIQKTDKGYTDIPDGFRVRLLNLPKKKNIRKDLRLAFEGVRGMLNIVPVVSGNEKTRDPVCKGLAFIDFKNQDDAKSFVQKFSGKSVDFGKVQKQIKCEMVNPKKPDPTRNESDIENNLTPIQAVCKSDVNNKDADVKTDFSQLEESHEESDNPSTEVDSGDNAAVNRTLTTLNSDFSEEPELKEESESNSLLASKPGKKLKKNEKKSVSKKKKDKINPKLKIPGSANRLKIREKEMLTGVLSKYGAMAVTENSR